jgi:hypothetical protein
MDMTSVVFIHYTQTKKQGWLSEATYTQIVNHRKHVWLLQLSRTAKHKSHRRNFSSESKIEVDIRTKYLQLLKSPTNSKNRPKHHVLECQGPLKKWTGHAERWIIKYIGNHTDILSIHISNRMQTSTESIKPCRIGNGQSRSRSRRHW